MIVHNKEAFVCLEALLFLQGSIPTTSGDLFLQVHSALPHRLRRRFSLIPTLSHQSWRHSFLVTGELQKNDNSSVNVLGANFVSTLH